MICHMCRYERNHHPACPDVQLSDKKASAKIEYDRGYRDGCSGKEDAQCISDYSSYTLGHIRGVAALEEYENAHDARFDE